MAGKEITPTLGVSGDPGFPPPLDSIKVSLPSTVVLSGGNSGILPFPGSNKANPPCHQWRSLWDPEFPSSPSINEEDKWES